MPRYFTASLALLVLGAFAIEPAQAVLVAHYQFENNLNDSSSNGHTGTFVGTTSIVNDPVRGNVLNVPESGNQGVNIDTVVPIPDFVANSSITLTAWYKRQASVAPTGNFRYVVDLGQNGNNPIASLGIHSGGYIASYGETDEPISNGDQVNNFGTTVIEENAPTWASWHHLAIVYDKSTDLARIYVDGALDSSTDISFLRDDFPFSWPAANIGRGPEGASSTAPGLIDEVRIYDHALSSQEIIDVMGGPAVLASVNRSTGNLTIQNLGNAPGTITSYSLSSGAGALNPDAWTSVADNYDSGGVGSIDTNPWAEMSATTELLSEAESPAVNGATFALGQSVSLGQVWRKSIFEELVLTIEYSNGQSTTTRVQFEGGFNNAPFLRSDLNTDGDITLDDWEIYIADLMSDLSSVSDVDAYLRGDLNGDGVNDGFDFAIFKTDYDALHGAGAFQAAIGRTVPEPATLGLGLLAVGCIAAWRRQRRNRD